MLKQKDAVVQFWNQGSQQGLAGKDLESFVANEVYHGIASGDIEHRDESIRTDEKRARSYAKSLTSNHFKKAKEINGGVKYEPATKRGPVVKDQRLKDLIESLKALKANNADMNLISQVEAAAEARRAEVDAEKSKSKLPSIEDTMAKLAELGISV